MSSKITPSVAPTVNLPTLRIGSRVRCTDDGVRGRIVWANGVSVKIRWDDGEQVTWRRDSLADRPLEILVAAHEGDQSLPAEPGAAPAQEPTASEQAVTTEVPVAQAGMNPTAPEQAAATDAPIAEPMPPAPEQADATPPGAGSTGGEPAPAAAKPKRQRQAAEPKEKKLSAVDAAAKVLAEAGTPLNCQEMIGAMAAKGYWSSPAGKTPSATLCSALLRDLQTKGADSRFVKTQRGKFARNAARRIASACS